MRSLFVAIFLCLAAFGVAFEARASADVDVAIVLAVDVSRSVWTDKGVDEYQLQKDGIVAALTDPQTIEAIENCNGKGVALSFVEWSGQNPGEGSKTVVGWTRLRDRESALSFARKVHNATRSFAANTDIAGAIEHSHKLFEKLPFSSLRKIVLLSSDGIQNMGYHYDRLDLTFTQMIQFERDRLIGAGIELDALVIQNEGYIEMLRYFKDYAVTPGGNSSLIYDFRDYASHFKKLLSARLCHQFTS